MMLMRIYVCMYVVIASRPQAAKYVYLIDGTRLKL